MRVVQERLEHVRWIGGGSGAGKSTVAGHLAQRYGMRLYSTDEAMGRHAAGLDPTRAPMLAEFVAMDLDQRWCHRSPTEMLETFHWFRGEGFDLIVEDLLDLPNDPVIVEGFRLLPHLVHPLAAPGRAVWLLPSPQFRRQAFESRGSLWEIAGRTSNPEQALANLLERDRLFTDRISADVAELGLPAIDVRVALSLEALLEQVSRVLR